MDELPPILLPLLLGSAGGLLFYLGHRNQGLLSQPLPAVPARMAGALLLMLALVCGLFSMSRSGAIFACVMVAMLAFSLLPLLPLLFKRKPRDRKH